jgi:hypothetical protein
MDDDGMSMVEVIITTLLLSLVLLLITAVSTSFLGTNQGNIVRQREADEARVAMAQLADDLDRIVTPSAVEETNQSTAVVEAGANRIVFWVMLGAGATTDLTTVTFERCDNGTVVRATADVPPQPTDSPCGEADPEIIARNVGAGVFRYYARGTGLAMTAGADVAKIGSVEAVVAVRDPGGEDAYSTGTSTVIRRFHLTEWKDY